MSAVLDAADAPSRESLAERWAQVVQDPVLRELPFRIELNRWGHIEMTPPASPGHMRLATRIASLLREALGGDAFTECAIATAAGVKVADVVWCSDAFLARHAVSLASMQASLPEAPDLCIEVMSPSNSRTEMIEKTAVYLGAGAREAWIVQPDLTLEVRDAQGLRDRSALRVDWTKLEAALRSL
jgi:Uma2 family endonuclease